MQSEWVFPSPVNVVTTVTRTASEAEPLESSQTEPCCTFKRDAQKTACHNHIQTIRAPEAALTDSEPDGLYLAFDFKHCEK